MHVVNTGTNFNKQYPSMCSNTSILDIWYICNAMGCCFFFTVPTNYYFSLNLFVYYLSNRVWLCIFGHMCFPVLVCSLCSVLFHVGLASCVLLSLWSPWFVSPVSFPSVDKPRLFLSVCYVPDCLCCLCVKASAYKLSCFYCLFASRVWAVFISRWPWISGRSLSAWFC